MAEEEVNHEWIDPELAERGLQNLPRDVPQKYRYYYHKEIVEEDYQKTPRCPFSLWLSEGKMHYRQRRYMRAEDCFSKVLAREPKHVAALLARCQCYCRLMKYDLAMNDAVAARLINPDHLGALYQKAEVYFEAGYLEFAYLTYLHGTQKYRYPQNGIFQLGVYKCKVAIMNCIGPESNLNIQNKDVENIEVTMGLRKKPQIDREGHLPSYIEGIPDAWNEHLFLFIKRHMKERALLQQEYYLKKDHDARMVFGAEAQHKELLQEINAGIKMDARRNPRISRKIKADLLLEDVTKALDFIKGRQMYWQRLEPIHAGGNDYQKEPKPLPQSKDAE